MFEDIENKLKTALELAEWIWSDSMTHDREGEAIYKLLTDVLEDLDSQEVVNMKLLDFSYVSGLKAGYNLLSKGSEQDQERCFQDMLRSKGY